MNPSTISAIQAGLPNSSSLAAMVMARPRV